MSHSDPEKLDRYGLHLIAGEDVIAQVEKHARICEGNREEGLRTDEMLCIDGSAKAILIEKADKEGWHMLFRAPCRSDILARLPPRIASD